MKKTLGKTHLETPGDQETEGGKKSFLKSECINLQICIYEIFNPHRKAAED